MSQRFVPDDNGDVKAIERDQVEWEKPTNGVGPTLSEVPDTHRSWRAQLVLLAMGFLGAEKEGLVSQLGVSVTDRGVVAVDENKMTSRAGVFAAGDIERGQSLVVWAIADGRRAAAGVDKYLMGTMASV